jgi:hypothetical protein
MHMTYHLFSSCEASACAYHKNDEVDILSVQDTWCKKQKFSGELMNMR